MSLTFVSVLFHSLTHSFSLSHTHSLTPSLSLSHTLSHTLSLSSTLTHAGCVLAWNLGLPLLQPHLRRHAHRTFLKMIVLDYQIYILVNLTYIHYLMDPSSTFFTNTGAFNIAATSLEEVDSQSFKSLRAKLHFEIAKTEVAR